MSEEKIDLASVVSTYGLTSHESERLAAFDDLLLATSTHTNLISRSTLADRLVRHYADSLQLWDLLPERVGSLLDIGSGAGFPGLVLAILARERRSETTVLLADSVGKKATFLKDAVEALGLANVEVTNARVETLTSRFDVVTARAVAALPNLLDLAVPRLRRHGLLVAPKGRRAEEELDEARRSWRLTAKRVKSTTDPDATILLLSDLERRR